MVTGWKIAVFRLSVQPSRESRKIVIVRSRNCFFAFSLPRSLGISFAFVVGIQSAKTSSSEGKTTRILCGILHSRLCGDVHEVLRSARLKSIVVVAMAL